jgi:hypothetical protein
MRTFSQALNESQEPPWHEAAKADENVGDSYRRLVALKAGFDRMAEIPKQYMPLYNEIGKAVSALADARQSTNQVREMVKRAVR